MVKRRLDNPNDFVRVEIAAALHRDIPVIPILLEGAKIPKPAQLPEELEDLSVRNGLEVRHASFHSDMDRLIQNIKKNALESKTGGESPVTALGFGKFFAFTQNRTAMIGGTLAMITLISGLLIWTVGTDHVAIAPRKELAPVPIPVPSPPEPLLSPSAARAPSPAPTTPPATTAAPTPVTPTAVATPPVPSAAPTSATPTTVTVMPPVTSDQNVGDPNAPLPQQNDAWPHRAVPHFCWSWGRVDRASPRWRAQG